MHRTPRSIKDRRNPTVSDTGTDGALLVQVFRVVTKVTQLRTARGLTCNRGSAAS